MSRLTVLEPEAMYPDTRLEQEVLGPDVEILHGGAPHTTSLDVLSEEVCAKVDGLLVFRHWLKPHHIARFPKLKVVVRMGVGYDRLDRAACAARGITVCNVPDYGTMEVADHAIALTLALRRGLLLHHDLQRADPPAPWRYIDSPLVRRLGAQVFGVLGLGRIGTAAALRAKALGFKVRFYDPFQPNGWDRALGFERARTLEDLLRSADVLSIHVPETRKTRGLIGAAQLALLPGERDRGEHRARHQPRPRRAGGGAAVRPACRRWPRRHPRGAAGRARPLAPCRLSPEGALDHRPRHRHAAQRLPHSGSLGRHPSQERGDDARQPRARHPEQRHRPRRRLRRQGQFR